MHKRRNIILAPLNWGLGHATRCIPICKALIKEDYNVIICSDGMALTLLRKEFPELEYLYLPGYNISYSQYAQLFKLKLLFHSPHVLKTINKEHELIENFVKYHKICGIISDNRFGVYSKSVPSIMITHQLKVFSGTTTWLSTKLNHLLLRNFKEIWIPDSKEESNLTGEMSRTHINKNINFIGPQSRFTIKDEIRTIDILCILSGPEPQRSFLENILIEKLKNIPKMIVLVRGVIKKNSSIKTVGQIEIHDYMTSKELETIMNQSKIVVCRSGYSSIMDLSALEKKAFLIPTPGQNEQYFLAGRMQYLGIAPYCEQDKFEASQLENALKYNGFKRSKETTDFARLFSLFKCE